MDNLRFNIYEDLEKVNASSLLIESNTEIASLEIGNIYLSLMCRGKIEIDYKEKTFYSPSQFPKIVTNYFLGKINDKELLKDLKNEIWVEHNNWYEVELFIKNDNNKLESIEEINDYVDDFDLVGNLEHIELSKSVMLYNILLGHFKDLKRDYEEKIKELENLDLNNL